MASVVTAAGFDTDHSEKQMEARRAMDAAYDECRKARIAWESAQDHSFLASELYWRLMRSK